MKAIVFAAGFGTRLRPFTETVPKSLFPVAGRSLIDVVISNLIASGCEAIVVNSHHLADKIEAFFDEQTYSVPVKTRYEPEILGTGGAVKNAQDFWDDRSFMAVNSDIFTDIPLDRVYAFHRQHNDPVTLVLFDDPDFNTVGVDNSGLIVSFDQNNPALRRLTFTGIQVLDPQILDRISPNVYVDIIDVYRDILADGKKIRAYVADRHRWKDIGTPERYASAVFETMAPSAFHNAFPDYRDQKIDRRQLAGDGSDRRWQRLVSGSHSLVLVDHGIRQSQQTAEVDAFIAIGNHLSDKGIPTPRIVAQDAFSGLVFVQDLGDVNLQAVVRQATDPERVFPIYREVVDLLVRMSLEGAADFDPRWTYQTPAYDRELILEKECRYFIDAFLNRFAEKKIGFEEFKTEFEALADNAVRFGNEGFMHRDFQSRNIMLKDGRPHFIDFQGARIGPIQYDLAALLIDPYVELPLPLQTRLAEYCADRLAESVSLNRERFLSGYAYCRITRNLQILGAFGYLSRVKAKRSFETYIPAAVRSLKQAIRPFAAEFPRLHSLAQKLTFDQSV